MLYDTYLEYMEARNRIERQRLAVDFTIAGESQYRAELRALEAVNWLWLEGVKQGVSWELIAVAVKAYKQAQKES